MEVTQIKTTNARFKKHNLKSGEIIINPDTPTLLFISNNVLKYSTSYVKEVFFNEDEITINTRNSTYVYKIKNTTDEEKRVFLNLNLNKEEIKTLEDKIKIVEMSRI